MKANKLRPLPITIYCLVAALWSGTRCMDNSEDRIDQEAAVWYHKATVQGDPIAQTNLGWMYKNGWGVNQSDIEAVTWYRKAAVQENAIAQTNLGWMYQNGWGVNQNDIEAVTWYHKAAVQGNAIAQTHLEWMYQKYYSGKVAYRIFFTKEYFCKNKKQRILIDDKINTNISQILEINAKEILKYCSGSLGKISMISKKYQYLANYATLHVKAKMLPIMYDFKMLPNITSLTLKNINVDFKAIKILCTETIINYLNLYNNNIGYNDKFRESRSILFSNNKITSLVCGKNNISCSDLEDLCNTRSLTYLYLYDNKMKISGIKALCANTNLQTLHLGRPKHPNCEIEKKTIEGVGHKSIKNLSAHKSITSLGLYNKISFKDIKYIANNTHIKNLQLWNSEIKCDGIKLISGNTILTTLYLIDNMIGDCGAIELAANQTLTDLTLYKNNINDKGAVALATLNTTLRSVALCINNVSNEGAMAFATNTSLTFLDLKHNNIRDEGAIALALNPTVTHLNLSYNKINNSGSLALSKNTVLKFLDLENNNIKDNGCVNFFNNTTLMTLKLNKNYINQELLINIYKCLHITCILEIDAMNPRTMTENIFFTPLHLNSNNFDSISPPAALQNPTVKPLKTYKNINSGETQTLAQNIPFTPLYPKKL